MRGRDSKNERSVRYSESLISKLYVPLVTLVLLLVVGNYLASQSRIDPLSLAQNRRMQFQAGDSLEASQAPGFTPTERKWADAVVQNGFRSESVHPALLYLGDSQTMAITDWQPGDLTTPQWLQVLLLRRLGAAHAPVVILGSQANLNMAEFLVEVVSAAQWNPRVVHVVIGSLALKEWRAMGIRESIAADARIPAVRTALASLVASHPDLTDAIPVVKSEIESAPGVSTSDKSRSPSAYDDFQNTIEGFAGSLPIVAMRPYLYANLWVIYINARNRLLNIRTDSPRPVPEPSFRASLQLLELALSYAQSRKIPVVLYLAPIRPVKPNPNLSTDVARLRSSVRGIAEKYDTVLLDYTDLVPNDLWTRTPDDPRAADRDFAHFTGAAHELVAQHLMNDIGGRLIGWTGDAR